MKTLHDTDADRAALGAAWDAGESFALLPPKAAVDEAWVAASLASLPKDLDAGHFVLLTSGSTGRPKLVVSSKARTARMAEALHAAQGLDPVAETVLALPLSYCYAFVNQWVWARVRRRRLLPSPGFSDVRAFVGAVTAARDAMLCLVGVQVPLLLQAGADRTFPGVRHVNFAGGRFPQEALPALRRLFPSARVFNNYGCTEAMPRLTLRPADDADAPADIGRPLPGVELKTDTDSQLVFRSPYGAVAQVDENGFRRISPDDWVPTGDLAEPLAGGGWKLTGRVSEVFKRYGEKVSIGNVISSIKTAWPGDAAAYREADRSGENGFVLVVAPSPTDEQIDGLLLLLRAKLPRAQWPLRIESAAEMPRLHSGKIDTSVLTSLSKTVHWRQRI